MKLDYYCLLLYCITIVSETCCAIVKYMQPLRRFDINSKKVNLYINIPTGCRHNRELEAINHVICSEINSSQDLYIELKSSFSIFSKSTQCGLLHYSIKVLNSATTLLSPRVYAEQTFCPRGPNATLNRLYRPEPVPGFG